MEKLTWSTIQVRVNDLKLYIDNPRKITEERRQRLIESLDAFGLAEIPAVNADMVVIAGNQRVTALLLADRGNEMIDVRYPRRMLTEGEVKRYNLLSNTHAGEWDYELLEREFSEFNLADFDIEMPNVDFDQLPDHKEVGFNPDQRWFLNIECDGEAHAMKLYDELMSKGLNVKIVN